MMIDYLPDEMLREILCRLPCYRTALVCKAVSKRWCLMISDPLFITQAFLTHREIKEEDRSLVFLLIIESSVRWDHKFVVAMITPPCFQRTLWSPFLSLQFLPHHSKIVSTFKDLILSYRVDPLTGLHVFYICNPLIKQWMVLPPTQLPQKWIRWAALTYLDGHGFRVVVAHSRPKAFGKEPFIMINLLIYISETCQWRNIDVRLQLKLSKNGYYSHGYFQGVACKSLVCIRGSRHFGALNPFDVTDTFHGTLAAIDLPAPGGRVIELFETDGKLVAFENSLITLRFTNEHLAYLLGRKRIWKHDMRLNNDKKLRRWELLSEFDGQIHIKGTVLPSHVFDDPSSNGDFYDTFKVVGLHPSKEHLLYLIQEGVRDDQTWLFLFDTKSKTLERLTKSIPPHEVLIFNTPKLDIPCWPTPIPIP